MAVEFLSPTQLLKAQEPCHRKAWQLETWSACSPILSMQSVLTVWLLSKRRNYFACRSLFGCCSPWVNYSILFHPACSPFQETWTKVSLPHGPLWWLISMMFVHSLEDSAVLIILNNHCFPPNREKRWYDGAAILMQLCCCCCLEMLSLHSGSELERKRKRTKWGALESWLLNGSIQFYMKTVLHENCELTFPLQTLYSGTSG